MCQWSPKARCDGIVRSTGEALVSRNSCRSLTSACPADLLFHTYPPIAAEGEAIFCSVHEKQRQALDRPQSGVSSAKSASRMLYWLMWLAQAAARCPRVILKSVALGARPLQADKETVPPSRLVGLRRYARNRPWIASACRPRIWHLHIDMITLRSCFGS